MYCESCLKILTLHCDTVSLLQIQTNIVQFLISNATNIGMVSESVLGRTQLLGYLPSDDELEKSDDGLNDSKPKKKKKRSGSWQGQYCLSQFATKT